MPATYTKSTVAAPAGQREPRSSNERYNSSSSSSSSSRTSAKLAAATSGCQQQSFERGDSIQSGEGGGQDSLNSFTNSDENRSLNNSNAEYDHIRNTTLMFFLDRLFIASKEGKGPRTLHDLSCLFGKREFTKEMRQIVGASRNGLKKFLQSYPSLFTIDGDKVYLTQLKQDPTNPAVRDYNREAIEYFTKKLQQFGTSLVPIRNLFGYRSQASQEVRHVSGKSITEFKEFLAANSDVFEMLVDEHVVLKSVIEEFESRGESYSLVQMQQTLPGEEVVMDPYLNKQFAHFIEDIMKKMSPQDHQTKCSPTDENQTENRGDDKEAGQNRQQNARVTIEFLHEKILQDCNNQLFLKMVETIDEFRVFLRMHPKIFKRSKINSDSSSEEQREYVSLLSDEERKKLEAQAKPSQQAPISRQQSTLRRSDTYESNISVQSSINSSGGANQQQATSLPPAAGASASNFGGQQQLYQQISDQPMSMIDPTLVAKSSSSSRCSTTITNLNNNYNKGDLFVGSRKPIPSRQATTSSSNSLNNDQSSSLRAAAPPFVPKQKLPGTKPSSTSQTQLNQSSKQQPALTANQASSIQQQAQAGRGIIDPRQAVRSYLIKASASNATNSGIYAPNKQSNGGSGGASIGQQRLKSAIINQEPLSRQSSNVNVDDLRARTVSIVREASNIITKIINTTDAVAFDCKGYNLGFNGQISLILFGFIPNSSPANGSSVGGGAGAILAEKHNKKAASNGDSHNNLNQSTTNNTKTTEANRKPEVCIFDLITNPELAYCLKPLLESDKVIKVVHDVRNKSNALFVQFDIVLNNVFDTQVANLVIQQQETGKPAYMSRYISMEKLCEVYGDEALEKYRNLIKSKTRHSTTNANSSSNNQSTMKSLSSLSSGSNNNQPKFKDVNYWRARPLTEAMVYESTIDVYSLLSGVYQNLKSKIKPEYQTLCKQLNDEGVLARIKPDEIRSIKKERKIDLEVIDLKRKLYSDSTGFIVLSNREIRLLRHIEMTDEVRKKIQQSKKVAKKLERLDMKQAQQNQLLSQSMNSQLSSDGAGDQQQSLDPNSSLFIRTNNGSSENEGSSSSINNNNHQQQPPTEDTSDQQNKSNSSELSAAAGGQQSIAGNDDDGCGMSNLMDSSMFDELKDKMIESSSLLESLEDDDDDDEQNNLHHMHHHLNNNANHSHHQHSKGSDGCRCQCHHKTTSSSSSSPPSTTTVEIGGGADNKAEESSKDESLQQQQGVDKNSELSLKSSASSSSIAAKSDKDQDSSVESRVADIAVQCDLLS